MKTRLWLALLPLLLLPGSGVAQDLEPPTVTRARGLTTIGVKGKVAATQTWLAEAAQVTNRVFPSAERARPLGAAGVVMARATLRPARSTTSTRSPVAQAT